jgi:hypothetical protein
VDACNLLTAPMRAGDGLVHAGIGRGSSAPSEALVAAVHGGFQAVERGVANELSHLVEFLNARYADSDFSRVRFADVQRIAGTCPTGCAIVSPGVVVAPTAVEGFQSRLVARAVTCA